MSSTTHSASSSVIDGMSRAMLPTRPGAVDDLPRMRPNSGQQRFHRPLTSCGSADDIESR